jgi:hypothetical protein
VDIARDELTQSDEPFLIDETDLRFRKLIDETYILAVHISQDFA